MAKTNKKKIFKKQIRVTENRGKGENEVKMISKKEKTQ